MGGSFELRERGVSWVYVAFLIPPEGESARVKLSFEHVRSGQDDDQYWSGMSSALQRMSEPDVWYHTHPFVLAHNYVFPWGSRTLGGENPLFVQAGPASIDRSTDGSEVDSLFTATGQTAQSRGHGSLEWEFSMSFSVREAMGASDTEEVWGHFMIMDQFGSPLEKKSNYTIEWSGTEVGFAYGDNSRLFEYRASDFESDAHAGVGGFYAGAGRELIADFRCRESFSVFSFFPGNWVASRYLGEQSGEAWVEAPTGDRHEVKSISLMGWTYENGPWGFHVDPTVRVDQWGEAQVFGACLPRIAIGETHEDWYHASD